MKLNEGMLHKYGGVFWGETKAPAAELEATQSTMTSYNIKQSETRLCVFLDYIRQLLR